MKFIGRNDSKIAEIGERNTVKELLGFITIRDGILITKEGYFLFTEVLPANIKLKSDIEQRYIISQFEEFLKVIKSPFYFFTIAKRGDAKEQVDELKSLLEAESSESVKEYIAEYMEFIAQTTYESSCRRRFIVAFPYINIVNPEKPYDPNLDFTEVRESLMLKEALLKEKLAKAGNDIVQPENKTAFTAEILFELLNIRLSEKQSIKEVFNV